MTGKEKKQKQIEIKHHVEKGKKLKGKTEIEATRDGTAVDGEEEADTDKGTKAKLHFPPQSFKHSTLWRFNPSSPLLLQSACFTSFEVTTDESKNPLQHSSFQYVCVCVCVYGAWWQNYRPPHRPSQPWDGRLAITE